MGEYLIVARTPNGIWLTGTIEDHPFGVKVCDEESGFGIDDGRVIKLYVNDPDTDEELFAYERGWETYPRTPEQQELCDALLTFCASLPEQDVWRRTMRQPKMFLIIDGEVLEHEDD